MNTLLKEARRFSKLNDEQFQSIVVSNGSYEKLILEKIDNATNIEALWNIYEDRIKFFEIYLEWMQNFSAARADLKKGLNLIKSCKKELKLLTSIKNKYFTDNNITRCSLNELKDKLFSLKEERNYNSLVVKLSEATNENIKLSHKITLVRLSFQKKISKIVSYITRSVLGLLVFGFLVGGSLNLLENAYLFSICTAIVFFIQEFYISPKVSKYIFLRNKKFLKKGMKNFFNSLIIHELWVQEEINEVDKISNELKNHIYANS